MSRRNVKLAVSLVACIAMQATVTANKGLYRVNGIDYPGIAGKSSVQGTFGSRSYGKSR